MTEKTIVMTKGPPHVTNVYQKKVKSDDEFPKAFLEMRDYKERINDYDDLTSNRWQNNHLNIRWQ